MTIVYTANPINDVHTEWVRAMFPQLVREDSSVRAYPVVEFTVNPSCRVIDRAPVTIPEGTPLFIGACPYPQEWAGEGAPWWATEAASGDAS